MNRPIFLRILLLIIYIGFGTVLHAEGFHVRGLVCDSVTHEALSFTSVYIKNTTDGCQTDLDGNFSFITTQRNGMLVISSVGYRDKHIQLSARTRFPLKVMLSPISYELGEVTVKPKRERYSKKDNPAVKLVKEIIDNRDAYSLYSQDYFSRKRHELLTIALNNFEEHTVQAELLNKVSMLKNYLDTSLVSGKPILNISTRELIGSDHYRKSPKSLKKRVLARRRAGVDDFISEQEIDAVFEEVFQDVDIFQNDLALFRNRFTSPLSTLGTTIYKYYIMDTIMVNDEPCVDLAFVPFNSESHGFTGHLYVTTDSTHFIKWVQMSTPRNINLNFVHNITVSQTFTRTANGSQQLDKESLIAEFELTSALSGVYVKRDVTYADYLFDTPADTSIFERKEAIIEENESRSRTEDYWSDHRIGRVSKKELSINDMLTKLRENPFYYWTEKIISFIFTGYIPIKKYEPEFFYGPINTTFSNNALEGFRLRVGGMTSAYLNPHLMGRFFVAYGFGDKRWKYMGELEYSFNRKREYISEFPTHSLRLHYENDIYQYGQTYLYTNKDNVFLNLKRMDDRQIGYLRKGEFSYNKEYHNHFSHSLTLRNRVFESSKFMKFESRQDSQSVYHHELQQTELELSLRYAPNEKFRQKKWDRKILSPENPVFALSHSIAWKDVLGTQFTCQRTEGSFRKRFWLSSFGYIDAVVKGGHVWNKVPYPLLIFPNANLSYTLQKESFALMNPMEFVADSYASWETIYYMNGAIFNRIPLLKKLGWREVIDFKGFWGNLSAKNVPDPVNSNGLFMFPVKPNQWTNMPYMELSVGIENIFKVLEIDYVRRLTYLNAPGIDKHGVRIRVHVQF